MIAVNRAEFLKHFAIAAAASPQKSPKEVLKCVAVLSDGESIQFKASDGEVHVHSEMEHKGEVVSALIPAARMANILREINGDNLELAFGKQLRIKCGYTDVKLGISEIADFPDVPTFKATAFYRMPKNSFESALAKTVFCTDPTSTRYSLSGIHFEVRNGIMMIESTDSCRMSQMACEVENANDPEAIPGGCVIPTKTVKLIRSALSDGSVDFELHSGSASFRSGATSVTTQTVQGRFPGCDIVLKPLLKPKTKIALPIGQLLGLVKQVRLLESAETKSALFQFTKGLLKADYETTEVGTVSVEIPIGYEGEDFKVILNGQYIAEFLDSLDDKIGTVDVSWMDDSLPILMEYQNCKHVIMPISVS